MLTQKINTPLTTSMGRLFDAVSALIGVRETATYEGQAAVELETACDPQERSSYEIPFTGQEILLKPLFNQIVSDLYARVPLPTISARFHNALAMTVLQICRQIRSETSLRMVAFSGGVWQNKTLLLKTIRLLRQEDFELLLHHQVPANDGGISLGQIMIANQVQNN